MNEPIPTWSYIEDELAERGWTEEDLAREMGGDFDYNMCAFAFMKHATGIRMNYGDFANRLGKAFGTSAEVWVNIDEQFHRELRLASEEYGDDEADA